MMCRAANAANAPTGWRAMRVANAEGDGAEPVCSIGYGLYGGLPATANRDGLRSAHVLDGEPGVPEFLTQLFASRKHPTCVVKPVNDPRLPGLRHIKPS